MSSMNKPQPVGNATWHPIAIWFFFWGEFAERASYYGMRAILPMYLSSGKDVGGLGFGDQDGGKLYYLFKMAAYFLPLVGGIVADRWLGRYWTIVGFSIPYVLGHFVLGIDTAWLGVDAKTWCMIALFALLAPGSGVIKPNISSMLGQTYDQQRPGQDKLRLAAFQFFYFAVNVGAFVSMLAMPYLRNEYGYSKAFEFPAWLMVGALVIFALGKPFYAKEAAQSVKTPAEQQEQSATLGLFFVIVLALASWLAFDLRTGITAWLASKGMAIPMNAYLSVIGVVAIGVIALAAKVYTMFSQEMRATLSKLFGVYALIAIWWMVYEHNDAIWVYFARDYMHHEHTTFTIPSFLPNWLGGGKQYAPAADSYQYINSLFVLIFIPVFNFGFRLIDPESKTFTSIRRVLIGFFISAMVPAIMTLAAYRTNAGTEKVTALWMVLAYIVLTAGEVLVYGTMLDVSYSAAPKSMKGFITACFLLTNTLGNFINSNVTTRYLGWNKTSTKDISTLNPVEFFSLGTVILVAATIAFYFVGKRFERSNTPAA